MNGYLRGFTTTVGTKFLVGLTGALLVLFVIGHLLGNLQIYLGADAINNYAEFLQSKPGPLWIVRLGLLAVLIVHIAGITKLTLANRAARPEAYAVKHPVQSTVFSRTMVMSGLILLAFIVYHLAHFTVGLVHPEYYHLVDSQGRHDVFSMMVLGFQSPLIAGTYIFAMGLLGMHLAHGILSVFQTMGWNKPKLKPALEAGGRLLALLIVLGNISIPLVCLLGWIRPLQEAL